MSKSVHRPSLTSSQSLPRRSQRIFQSLPSPSVASSPEAVTISDVDNGCIHVLFASYAIYLTPPVPPRLPPFTQYHTHPYLLTAHLPTVRSTYPIATYHCASSGSDSQIPDAHISTPKSIAEFTEYVS